ncbi:MAG TPA: exosortase A [Candidatus Eisenbacteria bacterium]|nr:exosortase A [Candidatus Eisenbacteria bacterium]
MSTNVVQPEVASASQNSAGTATAFPRWQLVVLGALSLWIYWRTLAHLALQWWRDPNFSHGFLVPIFAAYIVWRKRDQLARSVPQPSWSGVAFLLAGIFMLLVGEMGAELFLARSSLLLLIAGLIILDLGWPFFRVVVFPWAFLLLMIPIPTIVFNKITFPLQLLASRLAAAVLPTLGVPVLREGNIINLSSIALEVAEACSGIRSLMSLLALAIMYGYLVDKRSWVRWTLAISAVPIAVFANAIRVIGTGLLVQYWDPEKAEGYFHESWGWLTFVLSLFLLYLLHAAIRWHRPEEAKAS